MQDKTWYSILGLDAEPLFLQDDMLINILLEVYQNSILESSSHN